MSRFLGSVRFKRSVCRVARHASQVCALAVTPLVASLLVGCQGCEGENSTAGSAPSASAGEVPLAPEQASRVLAKVGDRAITLGDYVTALSRLDQFERLRYQTPERRRLFLDEMINVELLAREAERRGLDKHPETQAHLRQILREEVLRTLRAQLPKVEEIPATEVREYYEAHPDEFADPARRRVGVIALRSQAAAEKVLPLALGADARTWGQLVRAHSVLAGPSGAPAVPLEFEGDLGFVSEAATGQSDNPKVPEPVRLALFALQKQGDTAPKLVAHEGLFYILRLLAESPPRKRTLSEAETTIRVRLLHDRLAKAEANLEAELRETIPVTLNPDAIARLAQPVPSGSVGSAAARP